MKKKKIDIEVEIAARRAQHERDLARYCAGLQRAAHEMLTEAKDEFGRGNDVKALDRRVLAKRFEALISQADEAQNKEFDRWEKDMRYAHLRRFKR